MTMMMMMMTRGEERKLPKSPCFRLSVFPGILFFPALHKSMDHTCGETIVDSHTLYRVLDTFHQLRDREYHFRFSLLQPIVIIETEREIKNLTLFVFHNRSREREWVSELHDLKDILSSLSFHQNTGIKTWRQRNVSCCNVVLCFWVMLKPSSLIISFHPLIATKGWTKSNFCKHTLWPAVFSGFRRNLFLAVCTDSADIQSNNFLSISPTQTDTKKDGGMCDTQRSMNHFPRFECGFHTLPTRSSCQSMPLCFSLPTIGIREFSLTFLCCFVLFSLLSLRVKERCGTPFSHLLSCLFLRKKKEGRKKGEQKSQIHES